MTTKHCVQFVNAASVTVASGTLVTEAARLAGVEILQPCGGQGRCGRCLVKATGGSLHHRGTPRLKSADVRAGYALACHAAIVSPVTILVPPQERIVRRLMTERTALEIEAPKGYDPAQHQPIQRVNLSLPPPSLDDQTDDWSRLETGLRQAINAESFRASLPLIRKLGSLLRDNNWQLAALVETDTWDRPGGHARVVNLCPGHVASEKPLWGAAIDIGTTTVTLWLVDLRTGQVCSQAADYNDQIARGEDVISRIIYATKQDGAQELRELVLLTIHKLLRTACQRVDADPADVVKATVAGNSTMIHLLLEIPASSIRLEPFITGINQPPTLRAAEIGLGIHPDATVDCLPGISSYVGADITAGVLASGVNQQEAVTLFMDIGTNGELVLGNREWLVACACSAGPAFEGAGVVSGMRATRGAIEEVWVNSRTYEPTYRVIGGGKPRGLCGSGLIALLAELFLAGVIDKSGNIRLDLPTARVRAGPHGSEYVVAWAGETRHKRDVVLTRVDVDNLLRAKAAIYAGFTVLAESVGFPLDALQQVFIGGAFGKYIHLEKAIQIGLLPDLPLESFRFLGNTSVQGAYLALLDRGARLAIKEIGSSMSYLELSASNAFYDAFTSALFLPHTDLSRFPTVQAAMVEGSEHVHHR